MSAAAGIQGGLFVEPKRWVARPPAENVGWWGVDVRTALLSIGMVSEGLRRTVDQLQLGGKGPSNGERLYRYERQIELFVSAALEEGRPVPGMVWVEQASGQRPVPELVYCVAVTTATFYRALRNELGYPVPVETVPSSTWKAACGVGGRASKNDPETGKPWRPKDRYPILQWARLNGYEGPDDWDNADAWGIVEGLRATVGLR